jgi:hypothetical protein
VVLGGKTVAHLALLGALQPVGCFSGRDTALTVVHKHSCLPHKALLAYMPPHPAS